MKWVFVFLLVLFVSFSSLPEITEGQLICNCTSTTDNTCELWFAVGLNFTMVYQLGEERRTAWIDGQGTLRDARNSSFIVNPESHPELVIADGIHRSIVTINGSFPAPTIIITDGTTLIVHVANNLIDGEMSIHWHGIQQRSTPWMDGVARVSQCGIPPGSSFTYRMTATPAGTQWYHAHAGAYRTDGVAGALIIIPKERPPEYEVGYVLLLQDWMHEHSLDLFHQLNQGRFFAPDGALYEPTNGPEDVEIGPVPFKSGIISGKGRYVFPNNTELLAPLNIYSIDTDSTIIFRLIGAQNVYAFEFSIDNHTFEIIGTDGADLDTKMVDSLIVHSGERYDIEVVANQPESNYWIRARTLETTSGYTSSESPLPHQALAVLHYNSVPTTYPSYSSRTNPLGICLANKHCRVANCPFHHFPPLYNKVCLNFPDNLTLRGQPIPADQRTNLKQYFFNFAFGQPPNFSSINGRRLILPTKPFQTQSSLDPNSYVPCNDAQCNEATCQCTYWQAIDGGANTLFIISNMKNGPPTQPGGTPHPVHLHGHLFRVLKMGYPVYSPNGTFFADNKDIDCGIYCNEPTWRDSDWLTNASSIPGLHWINPPEKDTLIIPSGGYAVIWFKADNPGWWFFHCHIEIHQLEGMAMIIKEGNPSLPNKDTLAGLPKCGIDISTSAGGQNAHPAMFIALINVGWALFSIM